ncbi:MAG TPA: hypothetical protein VNZ52_11760 [Candidatus Thermoplasmatota archaeon]|nr:hypothetical protein [Candidatus Thermoplasmatota archaeon]
MRAPAPVSMFLALLLSGVLAGCVGTDTPEEGAPAPLRFQAAPDWAAGDEWVYRLDLAGQGRFTVVMTIVNTSAACPDAQGNCTVMAFRIGESAKGPFVAEQEHVYRSGTLESFREGRFDRSVFTFPLTEGKTWGSHNGTCTVGAAQTVTVPAGTYPAIPVACKGTDPLGEKTATTFYSDEARAPVKLLEERNGTQTAIMELVAMTRSTTPPPGEGVTADGRVLVPTWRVGDRWVFRVVGSGGPTIKVEQVVNRTAVPCGAYSCYEMRTTASAGGEREEQPASYMDAATLSEVRDGQRASGMRFPFRPGDTWQNEGGGACSVAEPQALTVEGETFDPVYPIRCTGETQGEAALVFYAPEVRNFVQVNQVTARTGPEGVPVLVYEPRGEFGTAKGGGSAGGGDEGGSLSRGGEG